jgi:hypothetical protein
MMEDKISKQWQKIQEEHYQLISSHLSTRIWAVGLITNLLSMTHSQWMHHNAVEHDRDAQGLKLKEGRELMEAITEQLALGLEGLHV